MDEMDNETVKGPCGAVGWCFKVLLLGSMTFVLYSIVTGILGAQDAEQEILSVIVLMTVVACGYLFGIISMKK